MRTAGSTAPMPRDSAAMVVLEIGESLLFAGLLVVGAVRSFPHAGSSVVAGAAGEAGIFMIGLLVHRRAGRWGRAVWVCLLLAGLLLLTAVSRDFLWLAFPVWLIAGQVLPAAVALSLTLLSLSVIVLPQLGSSRDGAAAILGPALGAAVALGISRGVVRLEEEGRQQKRLLAQVLEAQRETAELHEELVRAQREAGVQAERSRLARDIHDTLAQGFSSIILLARAGRRETDAHRRGELLEQIEQSAMENLAESRRVVYDLAPPDLATSGLAEPLQRLTRELGDDTGAQVSLDLDETLPRLPTAIEVALLRAAQGVLANVRRHAAAQRVAVTLSYVTLHPGSAEVRLDVVDGGVGFDPARLAAAPTLAGGYGLCALRTRLGELGGGVEVESEPGAGTAVAIHLPIRLGEGQQR